MNKNQYPYTLVAEFIKQLLDTGTLDCKAIAAALRDAQEHGVFFQRLSLFINMCTRDSWDKLTNTRYLEVMADAANCITGMGESVSVCYWGSSIYLFGHHMSREEQILEFIQQKRYLLKCTDVGRDRWPAQFQAHLHKKQVAVSTNLVPGKDVDVLTISQTL